ncbi:MAG: elongation factor Ts [Chloroflexota bacterium]|nr:elongation factor Ts [Chloroflexota bacterium]
MQVSTEAIKALREKTNAGIMECKRVLQEVDGDLAAATQKLRERGYEMARKKESRTANQGLVESYIHTGGRVGVLVEVNCESDFVSNTQEFKDLAHDIAMQIVAANPRYINPDDAPEGTESTDDDCLLLQPFIKDPSKTVNDLITETIAKVRENIKVKRFSRFELGLDGEDTQP